MTLRLSQRSGERTRSPVKPRPRIRGQAAAASSTTGTDEWVRLDAGWRIVGASADVQPYLDPQDPTAMALSAWPAIGSAERLVTVMGMVRDGTATVAMPAADGVGLIVVTSERSRQGAVNTTTWRRAALVGSLPPAGDSEALLTAVAGVLSHDGIAPLRRAVAFAETALAGADDLPEAVRHRLSQSRDEVLDASDLVREIVATMRVDSPTAPGRCELAALRPMIAQRCQDCGLVPRWDIADADTVLTVDAAAAAPVFAACAVISAAVQVNPAFTRTNAQWTLAVPCPGSAADGMRLLRLGASLRDGAGRTIRPRLALAARHARANGWQLIWEGSTLLVHGICIPARKDS